MKKLFIAIVMLGSTLMLYAAKADKKVTITVGNESREYWLYVPNNVKAEAPLVLSLHGAGGQCTDKSPFRTNVADKEGCIVAYPQGKMTTFPGLGGMQAYGWSAYGEENFDTDFLKAVVEDVASKYTIDRQRLYCCGFSNGGMMTYVMANPVPEKTTVSGKYTKSIYEVGK
ncbi:MAG: prolyl oligopeptidase family serine peptidase [Prevotella sp.]|nr:prolyl oligopeptidase family serine peptidase [Prevotella sp.]